MNGIVLYSTSPHPPSYTDTVVGINERYKNPMVTYVPFWFWQCQNMIRFT